MGDSLRQAQHWGFRFLVTFAAALAIFGYVQGNARFRTISSAAPQIPLRLAWIAAHVGRFVPLALLTHSSYGGHGLQWSLAVIAPLWLLVALGSVASLVLGLAP